MIILRQKSYADLNIDPSKVTGVSGIAQTTPGKAPFMPNYNPNAGAKERTTAMINNAKNSVGLKQGAINTWKNMGTGGKIATGVAGAALIGGAAKMIHDKRKAEREAEEAKRAAYRR